MNKKRNFHSFQLKFCHKNSGFSGDLSDTVTIGSAFYVNKTFSVNPIRTKVGRFRWRLATDFLFFFNGIKPFGCRFLNVRIKAKGIFIKRSLMRLIYDLNVQSSLYINRNCNVLL